MTLKANQPKTGHLLEDSPNTEPKGGRHGDGTQGGQPVTGHLPQESANTEPAGSGDGGFKETQGTTGFSSQESANPKEQASSTPTRTDKVADI